MILKNKIEEAALEDASWCCRNTEKYGTESN